MDVSALIDSVDMPLAELARRMGVSDGHVFDLKSGRRRLTVKMAAKLEAALERPGIVDDVLAAMRREAA
jgi:plasmid maintenance system antidote protein VapI